MRRERKEGRREGKSDSAEERVRDSERCYRSRCFAVGNGWI